MSKQVFDLENYLKTLGFKIIEGHSGWGFIAEDDTHVVSVLLESNRIQFGFKSSFDRWANSVDYEENIPHTRTRMDKALTYVDKMIKCSRCEEWGAKGDLNFVGKRPYCNYCYNLRIKKGKK